MYTVRYETKNSGFQFFFLLDYKKSLEKQLFMITFLCFSEKSLYCEYISILLL